MNYKIIPEFHYQFERLGFFVVDKDSNINDKKLVFNMTVNLRDSKPKDENNANRSRKEEQDKQLADKLARMKVNPIDMFKNQTELYSKFDEEGKNILIFYYIINMY